jgi:hypothetical protein
MIIGTKQRTKENEQPKPTRYYSKKQEEAVAKAVGGRRSKNSGATMFDKSDVSTNKFNLECKTKTSHSDSISIKKEWFEKNKQEAMFMNKPYSAVVFNFGPDEENHYIIDEYLFQFLLDKLDELEETI